MINTTDDAIKICKNEITLVGGLDELLIDVTAKGDSALVKYSGVVVVNGCYITFYGKITNSSSAFYQTIDSLNQLKASVKSVCVNGEDGVEYHKDTSVVYVIGRLSAPNSINATYIAPTTSDTYAFLENVVGIPFSIDKDVCKVLIFNNHYHNVVTIQIDNPDVLGEDILFKMVQFDVVLHNYTEVDNTAMSLKPRRIVDADIDRNIVDNAIKSHQIYLGSLSK